MHVMPQGFVACNDNGDRLAQQQEFPRATMSTQDRRAKLRQDLIHLAKGMISEGGLDAVKARPLAQQAGCSVGAIYNVFGDLKDLILAVNGETFAALGAHVRASVPKGANPPDQLIAMSETYLDFAQKNPRLWRALFDVEMQTDGHVPDWYLAALDQLLALIDHPVSAIYPECSPDEIRLRTRTLFSAVHGIVLLGVERRISAVQEDYLRDMIRFLLRQIVT